MILVSYLKLAILTETEKLPKPSGILFIIHSFSLLKCLKKNPEMD